MRFRFGFLIAGLFALPATSVLAQPAGDGGGRGGKAVTVDSMVDRIMAFDANKDGKVTRDEMTDKRLLALFDRADANKDGVVSREELSTLLTRELAASGGNQRGGQGQAGPPDRGGPDAGGPGAGPGGRDTALGGAGGGRNGRGGPARPGQILQANLQDALKLTDDQKKQVAEMQKEVDAKLEKLLTPEQNAQLKQMRERGPGGPGEAGPGGAGIGGGPGGRGAGGQDRPPQ